MNKFRIAIQKYDGNKPVEFANVNILTEKSIKDVKSEVMKKFRYDILKKHKALSIKFGDLNSFKRLNVNELISQGRVLNEKNLKSIGLNRVEVNDFLELN